MVMGSKKIAIIGGSIWGNRGAAAMLETTIHNLRVNVPNAEIAVFTPYEEKDRYLSKDPSLAFFDSRPFALIEYFLATVWGWLLEKVGIDFELRGGAGALTGSDLLLDIGGITFADGRLKFLPYNILTIWPSLIHQVPVVKLSQAAGSFRNPLLRVLAKYFLSRCDHIFARGGKTKEYLEDLGLDKTQVSLAADIAFCFQGEYCLSQENELAVGQLCAAIDHAIAEGQKIICVSPSVLVSTKMGSSQVSYADLLIEIIKKSDYQNETYLFVPNATREGSKKARNNDLIVINELRDRAEIELPSRIYNKIIWIDYDISTRGIEDIIQRANIVIASRFHAMVGALRLKKPTLIIGWGHKYKEVMKRFGQEEFVFDYQLSGDEVHAKLLALFDRGIEITTQISDALVMEKSASLVQFNYVAGKLLED